MSTKFEEIDPHPDVGPQFEGFIRYKRHTSRPTTKKPKKSHTSPSEIFLSYVLLFIVYLVIIIIIAFNFDKVIIDTDIGFLFLILTIISGGAITYWAYYRPNEKINETLGIVLALMIGFIVLWLIAEFYKFEKLVFSLALIGFILILFLFFHEHKLMLIIPLITFLIGALIYNPY